ncbi:hypothetical protein J4468_00540 [Candidatus Woesearchaeota archaeon]|nr:hypothetical protein [Candidatus Woesearchaeota archaeon]
MGNGENTGTDLEYFLSDIQERMRMLESKYTLFGERLLIINQNMIEEYKKIRKHVQILDSDIRKLKEDMTKVNDIFQKMIKEMDLFARKENLKILEKYITLWNPMNFITEEEVIRLISEHKKRG